MNSGWHWLRRRLYGSDDRVTMLRKALADAIAHCPTCEGAGRLSIPGAWLTCGVCGYWRRVLRETR